MHEAILFLVRVWREGGAGFRASARRVDEDEPHLFGEADTLARFLAEAPHDPQPALAATATSTSGDEQ
ncbi:MAG TPA: hypothetical protein PL196_05260 [Burkholderiaceae bacterium]|nr:hypothetical protein [Burkholderiaceae bacterium]